MAWLAANVPASPSLERAGGRVNTAGRGGPVSGEEATYLRAGVVRVITGVEEEGGEGGFKDGQPGGD